MVEIKPTSEERAVVEALSAVGIQQSEIALKLGIAEKTLRKHYREELDEGMKQAGNKVISFLVRGATGEALRDEQGATYGDCSRLAMFYAKTQLGWSETKANEEEVGQEININVLPPQSEVKVTRGKAKET